MENIYPAGPQGVPADLAQPSSTYKRQAWLAMASLSAFIALYFALAGWFAWTAYRTLVEGVATGRMEYIIIAAVASFFAVFMLKALFFVQRGSAPDAIEVTPAEQPRLFEYLHRLADEVGAPRPARVYLSARVNAAVFYDLSILNLIIPSRKNLEIGMALVNVLTLSEIKAVLAHEFGHFAQRSMAIGIWVYIAHQIAAHVVSKRDALDRMLQSLSRSDIRIAWVGWLMSLVVWSIRSLMDTLLSLVLLAQRALSRQMEFQADLVAVTLTGSNELVHALHKLNAADEAWGRTLDFTDAEIRQDRIPHDLFAVQTRITEKVAQILQDESYGCVPKVIGDKPEQHRVFKTSFAQPPQMWSTHPASADREENAKRRYLTAPHDARSAWLLFDDVEAIKKDIAAHLIGETEANSATAEETFQSLDACYALLQYDSRYRGVYLGRSVVLHATQAAELYQKTMNQDNVQQALSDLYAPLITDDLDRLRELGQERGALEALRDKVYQATGGVIVFRGREIARRQLPAAIHDVSMEEEQVRKRVLAHDRQCRSTHLAAASTLGGGWCEYLIGLIEVMHYTEHTLADLRDAQGLLSNVVSIVTADGKVSKSERKRLIATANILYGVLAQIHEHKAELALDPTLCERLGITSWLDMLEEFTLGPADDDNLNDWMNAIDSWVDFTVARLYRVSDAALEQLLLSEFHVERCVRESTTTEAAASASRIPASYPTLRPGQERKRQNRLDLWDRFQTADGFVPAILRLSVALVFVGGVLHLGSGLATNAYLTIYNGLDREVIVFVGKHKVTVHANEANNVIEFERGQPLTIETRTAQGEVIERFEPPLSGHVEHYVYNVASASPLVVWTAVYGSATKKPPRLLNAQRWLSVSVDDYFTTPPESVKTKGGGATRQVLEGVYEQPIEEAMRMLETDEARKQVILAHAKWDNSNTVRSAQWKALAKTIEDSKLSQNH